MASITRKPRVGPSAQKEATEANVFAAVESLLTDGARYTELGVQQIAETAGIGRSTFYVHFEDKTDLLIRLTGASTSDLFAAADVWLDTDVEDGYGHLEHSIGEVCRQRRRHHVTLSALAEVAAYDRVVGDFWRQQVDGFAQRLAKKIAAEKRLGRTAEDLDPKNTAFFLVWGVERALEQQMLGPAGDDARLVKAISRAIWLGIYGRAESLPD